MKWFSDVSNPSAVYLPQVFSEDEEKLVYQALRSAATSTDNRGEAGGPLRITGKRSAYVSAEQEATFKALIKIDGSPKEVVEYVERKIEHAKGRQVQRAHTWLKHYAVKYSQRGWERWWRSMAKLPLKTRRPKVAAFRKANVSIKASANPVRSGLIGHFGRDALNQWGRETSWNEKYAHHYRRVLPLLSRISEAFRLALPERWELQRAFVERLDPRFVIQGTVFTTVTVNENFRTHAHRDDGDLSQGFSNICVFSNGKKFSGGHLVLPEFGVEFALTPGDLLFIQNHEYIHENTPIVELEPDSKRMSLVCYAREDLAFCGTKEYEELRKGFQLKAKKFPAMWESRRWYTHLRSALGGGSTLISLARKAGVLNEEILWLSALNEADPLFVESSISYVTEIPKPNSEVIAGLRAIFGAYHFKTPRHDRVYTANGSTRDGVTLVDSMYIGDIEGERWGLTYCESESGAVKFDNNRFNVHGVARCDFLPDGVEKLTRHAFHWLEACWRRGDRVWLVKVKTGIPEAPYRVALTTAPNPRLKQPRKNPFRKLRTSLYASWSGLASRSRPRELGSVEQLCDLGWEICKTVHGRLAATESPVCEALKLRYASDISHLKGELEHWVRRAKNLGTKDYQQRYQLVAGYQVGGSPLKATHLHRPWNIVADREGLRVVQRQKHQPALKRMYMALHGEGHWESASQPLPILGAPAINTTMNLWTHRKPKLEPSTGQLTLTNGSTFWLFQALSNASYIKGRDVSRPTTADKRAVVSSPTVVTHLQAVNKTKTSVRPELLHSIRKAALRHDSAIPSSAAERLSAIKNYQIAIPTYGRSALIAERTLKTLQRYRVDPDRVTIFVADAVTKNLETGALEERPDPELYRERLANNPYGKRIVVGEKGIGNQRNFIQKYFPRGTHLVSIDDDISGFNRLIVPKDPNSYGKQKPIGDFDSLIEIAFQNCHHNGAHLWGLYASPNTLSQTAAARRMGVDTRVGYIIASCFGMIVRHDSALEVKLENHGEDQERSLRFFFKDGVVVRLNGYSVATKYFASGGLEEARSSGDIYDISRTTLGALAEEFPTLCALKLMKPTKDQPRGRWELRWLKERI